MRRCSGGRCECIGRAACCPGCTPCRVRTRPVKGHKVALALALPLRLRRHVAACGGPRRAGERGQGVGRGTAACLPRGQAAAVAYSAVRHALGAIPGTREAHRPELQQHGQEARAHPFPPPVATASTPFAMYAAASTWEMPPKVSISPGSYSPPQATASSCSMAAARSTSNCGVRRGSRAGGRAGTAASTVVRLDGNPRHAVRADGTGRAGRCLRQERVGSVAGCSAWSLSTLEQWSSAQQRCRAAGAADATCEASPAGRSTEREGRRHGTARQAPHPACQGAAKCSSSSLRVEMQEGASRGQALSVSFTCPGAAWGMGLQVCVCV